MDFGLRRRGPASGLAAVQRWLPIALLLLYFGIFLHGMLFLTEGVGERDAFYHARYAQLLPERGLSRAFPWMQFADWKDKFCDKDFLYHVYLAPFCTDAREPLVGAKVGTLVLALAVLFALYAVLKHFKVPWPVVGAAWLGAGSALWLNRMLMVRSHDLSVLLMLVAAWAILERRFWSSFVIAFIYAWSYSFPVVMLATAVAAEGGRVGAAIGAACRVPSPLAGEGRRERSERGVRGEPVPLPLPPPAREGGNNSVSRWSCFRIPLAVLLGLAVGLVIHPYSPYSLSSFWTLGQIAFSATAGGPLELGSEFQRISFIDLFVLTPGVTMALLTAFGLGLCLRLKILKGRTLSGEGAAAFGAAAVWFGGMFLFGRLVEYAAPLAILAAGLAVRDALGSIAQTPFRDFRRMSRVTLLALALGLAALLAVGRVWSGRLIREYALSQRQYYCAPSSFPRGRYFDGAAAWMREHLQSGAVVLNFHWDDFPELFYSAPRQYYLVGLDPTLMRLSYPEKARVLEEMRTRQRPLDFALLRATFKTDYLIMRKYRAAQYELLKSGRVRPVFLDAESVIYDLREAVDGAASD